jgi:heavy metal sensor kinase
VKRRFAGTRARLTLAFAGVLLAAIVVADVVIYLLLAQAETGAAANVLVSHASAIASGIEEVNGQVLFGGGDLPTETQQGIAIDAAVVSGNGSITATPGQALSSASLRSIAASARSRSTAASPFNMRDSRGVPRLVYAESLQTGQASPAVLIVSRSIGELQTTLARILATLAGLSLLLLLAGTLLAHRLTGRVLLPVRRITSMARNLSEHDLHRRVDVAVPPDELGELVATFNGMLARLEASFESLRRFTADASHELRSPLALMRSEIEGTLARSRSAAQYASTLRGLEGEVEHMSRTVDQLLFLARADAGALIPAEVSLDVADYLHEVAARWRPAVEARGLRIEVEAPESGTASADPDLLRRVLDNLIDNATRHAPAGGAVQLSGARSGSETWLIEVADDGPGIPPPVRAKLFQRFAHPNGSRSRQGGGAGLGLALSRAIAEAHGGSLELIDRPGSGAVFRLTLRSFSQPLAGDARLRRMPRPPSGRR